MYNRNSFKNLKLFTRKKDDNFCLYEYYARNKGLNSKGLFILMYIYYMPNGITQNEICRRTYSTKQVVAANIKKLLQRNYIFFEDSINDKRYKKIKLTESGRKFASEILDDLEQAEYDAFLQLDKEQQEIFVELFEIFNKRFKENIEALVLERGKDDKI